MAGVAGTEAGKSSRPPARRKVELAINDVFEEESRTYRIVGAVPKADALYLADVDDRKALPLRRPLAEFVSLIDSSRVTRAQPKWRERPLQLSSTDIAVRDKRWDSVHELIGNPLLFDAATRGPLLKSHAEAKSCSRETLLANLRLLWRHGLLADSLLGDHFRSGRVSKTTPDAVVVETEGAYGVITVTQSTSVRARGRRPKDFRYVPYAWPADMRRKALEAAKAAYLSDHCVTYNDAAREALREVYALRDKDGRLVLRDDESAILPPMGQRPTLRQLRFALRKLIPCSKSVARRHGSAELRNNASPTTGSVLEDCGGPADVYEVDDTSFDIHATSDDRSLILGKPTIHFIVDRWSRLIVAYYLSFDAPSWESAKQSLIRLTSDWEAECHAAGIKYVPSDFPARGILPNRLYADRAGFITHASDELNSLGIAVTNAPARTAISKPVVESTFKRHYARLHLVPGYEPPHNIHKRQRKHYEAGASLTLAELNWVVLRTVISLNRSTVKNYPLSPADIQAGHRAIPREIWERETQRSMTLRSRVDQNYLRRRLLPTAAAQVTRAGIQVNGCSYTCEHAVSQDWFTQAAVRGNWSVNVQFTPALVDEILVQDPKRKEVQHVAKLAGRSARFQGLSVDLVQNLLAKQRATEANSEQSDIEQAIGAREYIDRLAQGARVTARKATRGKSLTHRKNEGANAREGRALAQRQREQSMAGLATPDAAQPPTTDTNLAPVAPDAEARPSRAGAAANEIIDDFFNTLEQQ